MTRMYCQILTDIFITLNNCRNVIIYCTSCSHYWCLTINLEIEQSDAFSEYEKFLAIEIP